MLSFSCALHSQSQPDSVHASLMKMLQYCGAKGLLPAYNVTSNDYAWLQNKYGTEIEVLKYHLQTSDDVDLTKFSRESVLMTIRNLFRVLEDPLIPDGKPFFRLYRILYSKQGNQVSKK